MRRNGWLLLGLLTLVACPRTSATPRVDAPPDPVLLESFDYAWARVAEVHPYPDMKGLDWDAVRAEYRPRAEAARSVAEVRGVIQEMLGELGESHYAVFPPTRPVDDAGVADSTHEGSDEPAEEDAPADEPSGGAGPEEPASDADAPSPDEPGADAEPAEATEPETDPKPEETDDADEPTADSEVGIEVRLVGESMLVSRVLPGTSAAEAGIRPGWRVTKVGSLPVSALLAAMPPSKTSSSGYSLFAAHAVSTLLAGRAGTTVAVQAGPGEEQKTWTLERRPMGFTAAFGNFPPISVRFESDLLADGRVGYVGFTVFMPVVAMEFQKAMRAHRDAGIEALIVDLRGNPGGLAGMVMGLSGWLVGDRGAALGVMKMRDTELRFVVNPRARKDRFAGPVVVLVDGLSASTSELFAAGLKELGRVTVVGTTSAGMSLPSVIETLPDGDLLQFVTADLHTPGGVRIEGAGVVPDIVVPLDEASLLAGDDLQRAAAVSHLLNALAPEQE